MISTIPTLIPPVITNSHAIHPFFVCSGLLEMPEEIKRNFEILRSPKGIDEDDVLKNLCEEFYKTLSEGLKERSLIR